MDHKMLMEETVQADAAMLLDFLQNRIRTGNTAPISTREALEAIHRKQPSEGPLPIEAAYMERVFATIQALLPMKVL